MKTVTRLLRGWREGNQAALDQLLPLVYDELHRLAENCMRTERPDHTLRPTELVSEAYMRLVDGEALDLSDRVHFYAIAARTMRQVLVDAARKRCASKRGGGVRPVAFEEGQVAAERPEELLALEGALEALARYDERKAKVIELFYFGGLTQEEIAGVQAIHVNTVGRDLRFAEAWVHRYLREEN
jgi:RNA polymerase sigma factor (TIGR02999 family)